MKNALEPEIINILKKLWERGWSIDEIEAFTSVARSTVWENTANRQRYDSFSAYALAMARNHGCESVADYQEKRAQERGFASRADYNNAWAKSKGFATYNDYLQWVRRQPRKERIPTSERPVNIFFSYLLTTRFEQMGRGSQRRVARALGITDGAISKLKKGLILPAEELQADLFGLLSLPYESIGQLEACVVDERAND